MLKTVERLKSVQDGLQLMRPNELLGAWSQNYNPPKGEQQSFYTTLHGKGFDDAVRGNLRASTEGERAVYSSFSAAQWSAPYVRVPVHHFYAESAAIDVLTQKLKLSSAAKGENVKIITPEDEGLFLDVCEPSDGIVCTSVVRTYLDLNSSGERGREAAEFLRREKLKWHN